MKRIISAFMCIVLSAALFPFSASAKQNDYNGYPVILVPGYASASLCFEQNGKTKSAWGWKLNDIMPGILSNLKSIIKSTDDYLSKNNKRNLVETISKCLKSVLEPMECLPDGTSKYDVKPVLYRAYETCDSYLNKVYPKGDYRVELDMTRALDQLIGEENVFYFNCDFRMSALDCAEDLDRYIQDVKQYTDSEKVNIVAVSHGGLITAAYLALYNKKSDVYNVVMDEPALGGAGLDRDIMNGKISFDEETFVKYLEYHSVCETDFNRLVKAQQLGFLDGAMETIVSETRDSFLYWGSIWDFLPTDDYEKLKDVYLDKTESAALIKKSDYVHYNIMSDYKNIFKSAKERGINVNIIAGAGNRIVTGYEKNSDGIIAVESSTGALSAPFGKRFSDSYVLKAYSENRIISPSMEIDATDCYLPENTWIVNGLFHGMEFWDEYSRSLLFKLLLSETPMDVNSDKNYPQFHDTTSATQSVYIQTENGGYISPQDNEMTILNTSQKHKVHILNIKCKGLDLSFDFDFHSIMPGESQTVKFTGSIPEGITYSEITVTYFVSGSATPLAQRRQFFTAVNNPPESEDSDDEMFCQRGFVTDFESRASAGTLKLLDKIGLRDFANTFYDAAETKFNRLAGIIMK
ncbi:MAG: hypothetical protein IJU45_08185 [Clostridia bacterium]|nr:hypothetical protein [Clostridia bacterium]